VQGKFFGYFFHGEISHTASCLYAELMRYDTGVTLRYPMADLPVLWLTSGQFVGGALPLLIRAVGAERGRLCL